jgi:hypothetical protein
MEGVYDGHVLRRHNGAPSVPAHVERTPAKRDRPEES